MEGEQHSWNYSTFELHSTSDCFFNPNFECSMDQNDPLALESALSSLVSSPAASNAVAGDGFVIRDVIGKLGSICNSGEVSPQSCIAGSRNTSGYNTPLNSPPKLNLSSLIESQIRGQNQLPSTLGLSPLNADPGFVERAAKFSCFGSRNLSAQFGSEMAYGSFPKLEPIILSRVNSSKELVNSDKSVKNGDLGDSREGSSVSEQNPVGESAVKPHNSTRKRKANPKSKAAVKQDKNDETSNAKRSKSDEDVKKEKSNNEAEDIKKETAKAEEAPKDYIHVRARRGQATDSHSLAERVRREKISERMKFLQDLVPGCNKVTGKAVVLDEIINYVQSLQRQVEFLSMKLSTVNPRMENFNMETLLSKDMLQLPHNMLPLDSLAPALPYDFHMDAAIRQNSGIQLPLFDGFGGSAPQIPGFWEDDLHSLIQMGFPQNQLQTLHECNIKRVEGRVKLDNSINSDE
ncbi:hypothetical protein V2J09_014388 [Rumex salicifolius]